MAGTLKQEHDGTANNYVEAYHSTTQDRRIAQSFTTTDAYTIAGASFKLYDPGWVTLGTIRIYLTAADGSGRPTGADLASGTVSVAGLTADAQGEWKQVDFTVPYALSATTQYCICVECVEDSPTSGVRGVGSSISGYAGGENSYSFDGGTSWGPQTNILDHFFRTYEGVTVSTPTLDSPTDNQTNMYLNSDGLLQMQWSDADNEDISFYTVHFGLEGGPYIPQNDRTRYSIVSLSMFLEDALEYDTSYQWFVRKTVDSTDYDSEIFKFTTTSFYPPVPSGGASANGLNNMVTLKRLVAAANNKIWYET